MSLFFTLTLGWLRVGGGVAILVAHGFMDFSLSPLVLVSISGLMPILAALGAAGVEAGRDGVYTLLVGVQWLVLRRSSQSGGWWIIANSLGWLVSMALGAALAEMISVLGALLVTGMVSGAITGFAMQRLRATSMLESAITHPQSTRQSTFG